MYNRIASIDTNNTYLTDGTNTINCSEISPVLALIFKTMLLGAIDGLPQKLTIEFTDLTATTTLDFSKRSEN